MSDAPPTDAGRCIERLIAWLQVNRTAGDVVRTMLSPVSRGRIDAVEGELQRPLPAELRSVYAVTGGQDGSKIDEDEFGLTTDMLFPDPDGAGESGYRLIEPEFCAAYASILGVEMPTRWVPFAANCSGGILVLDDSAGDGRSRVLVYSPEYDGAAAISDSLVAWLVRIVEGLDSGPTVFDEEAGLCFTQPWSFDDAVGAGSIESWPT